MESFNCVLTDARWLKSVYDRAHINLAGLDKTIKATTITIIWKLESTTTLTSAATVCNPNKSMLGGSKWPKVKDLTKIIVTKHWNLANDLTAEYRL